MKTLAAIFTFFKHGLGDYLWDFFALFSFSLESFSRDLEQLTLTLAFQCSARLQEVECGKFSKYPQGDWVGYICSFIDRSESKFL